MEKDRKRSQRRALKERKVRRVKKWLHRFNSYFGSKTEDELTLEAKRMADNPKWCDHWFCNCQNFGKSMNEVKRSASAQEKLATWEEELAEDREKEHEDV